MLSKTRSGAVYGIDASLVEVEVNIAPGGNGDFQIVGRLFVIEFSIEIRVGGDHEGGDE